MKSVLEKEMYNTTWLPDLVPAYSGMTGPDIFKHLKGKPYLRKGNKCDFGCATAQLYIEVILSVLSWFDGRDKSRNRS